MADNKNTKKKYSTSSYQRYLACYPRPKFFKMFVSYANLNEYSRSELLSDLIEKKFNSLPPEEQARLIEHYDKNLAKK